MEKEISGVIEDLKQKDNLIILIRQNEFEKIWQHPTEITDFVIENGNLIGEINIFDIYEM